MEYISNVLHAVFAHFSHTTRVSAFSAIPSTLLTESYCIWYTKSGKYQIRKDIL